MAVAEEGPVRCIQLPAGSPRELGRAFGEACDEAARALYARRVANALEQARRFGGRDVSEGQLLELAAACLDACDAFDPAGTDELRGIADTTGLSAAQLLASGGLTDLRDALAWGGPPEVDGGCTAAVVQRDASADARLWCAQTWDLGTDNLPYVVAVHRRPRDAPATWCVTTAGCLSLMGVNECGLAVGTTNLRTRDARAGVPYLHLLHRALACERLEDAVERVVAAPRAGGHAYWLADPEGACSVLECGATRHVREDVASGFRVQTNHVRAEALKPLEADTPADSSRARFARMSALLEGARGQVDGDRLRQFLADAEGGPLAICRRDFDGITSNAALVLCADTGEARVCHGPPCQATWADLRA